MLGRRLRPRRTDLAALCGASWSYRQAGEARGWLRGAPRSHEAVRAEVGVVGQRVALLNDEGKRDVGPPSTK